MEKFVVLMDYAVQETIGDGRANPNHMSLAENLF